MSKSDRQNAIINIIRSNCVETQEDLVTFLRNSGFKATQATVSRDINELGLVKTSYADGAKKGLRYAFISQQNDDQEDDQQLKLLKEIILDVSYVNNLIVVKSKAGMANSAAAIIDTKYNKSEKIGSIAGDDTVLVIMSDNVSAETFARILKDYIK